MAKVLVTGGAGNAGTAVSRALLDEGYDVRIADVFPLPATAGDLSEAEFVRCDTRSPGDVRDAVEGVDAVVHLAAWHSAHRLPVGNDTMFATNVDGTYHVLEACRRAEIKALVFGSSMAYSYHWVYGVTKVVGEDLCKAFRRHSAVRSSCSAITNSFRSRTSISAWICSTTQLIDAMSPAPRWHP